MDNSEDEIHIEVVLSDLESPSGQEELKRDQQKERLKK